MQCVIPAAGLGTRMNHLTDNCPKPMLLIQGKPKLAYSIEMLPDEITEVILIVGYLKEQIIEYFGDEYAGRKITYVVHETIDGTGKIIHDVKDIVNDNFLVTMGDDLYVKEDLEKLLQHELAVLVFEVEDSSQFGVIKTDQHGNLEAIVEKPHEPELKLINAGAYLLNKEYFTYPLVKISDTEYGLPQTLVQMRDKHQISVVQATNWFPLVNPEALQAAQQKINEFI